MPRLGVSWHYPGSAERDWSVYEGVGAITGDTLLVDGDPAWLAGTIAPEDDGRVYGFGDGTPRVVPALVGGTDVYVAKYVAGTLAWVSVIGTLGDEPAPQALLRGRGDEVFLWGAFSGELFESGAGNLLEETDAAYLIGFDEMGRTRAVNALTSDGQVQVGAATRTPDGLLLLGAHTSGEVRFGGVTVLERAPAPTPGSTDLVVALRLDGMFALTATSGLRGLCAPNAVDARADGSFVTAVAAVGPQCPGEPASGADIEPDIEVLSFGADAELAWAGFRRAKGQTCRRGSSRWRMAQSRSGRLRGRSGLEQARSFCRRLTTRVRPSCSFEWGVRRLSSPNRLAVQPTPVASHETTPLRQRLRPTRP